MDVNPGMRPISLADTGAAPTVGMRSSTKRAHQSTGRMKRRRHMGTHSTRVTINWHVLVLQ